jgi:hypothetical protein
MGDGGWVAHPPFSLPISLPLPPSPVPLVSSVVLKIRMKKKTDDTVALTLVRADGTSTWQRQEGAPGRFFPFHDLTHFAVETALGHRKGFYGMVAGGWDFTDFGAPWPKGKIPADADPSELIVGFLDAERASGERWNAEDFNQRAREYFRDNGVTAELGLSDDDLARVRSLRAELFARWRDLPRGDTLELTFE